MTTRPGSTGNQCNISVWLPTTLLDRLNKKTKSTDVTRSTHIRRAITQYLNWYEKGVTHK